MRYGRARRQVFDAARRGVLLRLREAGTVPVGGRLRGRHSDRGHQGDGAVVDDPGAMHPGLAEAVNEGVLVRVAGAMEEARGSVHQHRVGTGSDHSERALRAGERAAGPEADASGADPRVDVPDERRGGGDRRGAIVRGLNPARRVRDRRLVRGCRHARIAATAEKRSEDEQRDAAHGRGPGASYTCRMGSPAADQRGTTAITEDVSVRDDGGRGPRSLRRPPHRPLERSAARRHRRRGCAGGEPGRPRSRGADRRRRPRAARGHPASRAR